MPSSNSHSDLFGENGSLLHGTLPVSCRKWMQPKADDSFLYESINIKFEELYPLPAPVARLQTSKQIFWGNMERKIFILILSSRRRHELQPEFRNATTLLHSSDPSLVWSSWHGHLVLLQKFPNKCLDGGEVN